MFRADFDLDGLEFFDRSGVHRKTYGYSMLGRTEFWQRLDKLHQQVSQELEFAQQLTPNRELPELIMKLYESDRWFKLDCDRCLLLNGVEPDWMDGSGKMLTSFLFEHEGGESLLVKLNLPSEPVEKPETKADEAIASVYDAIAALAMIEGGHDAAVAIAEKFPAKHVNQYLKARADLVKTPEDKKQSSFDEWAKKQRTAAMGGELIDLSKYQAVK